MFASAGARYVLRAVLFGLSGFLVALQAHGTPVDTNGLIDSLIAGGLAGLAYAGIGAAVPAVEPHIGNKLDA